MPSKEGRPNWTIWIWAARPKTLWAAVAPVLLGTAYAFGEGAFHALSACCAFLVAVFIQVGTNYANDYQDFAHGADTADRKGPMRVTQAGLASPRAVRTAAAVAFLIAFLAGLYLVARGGWFLLFVGLISILCGAIYSAGRYSLAYLGVADLFVLVFFGPVAVAGTHYAQALAFSWPAALAGLGPGFLATAILVVNNTRDIAEDRAAGKKTLVVRWGRSAGVALYGVCVAGAAAAAAASAMLVGNGWILVALLAMPWGLANLRTLRATSDPAALNSLLGSTSRLLLAYSLLFGLGWIM